MASDRKARVSPDDICRAQQAIAPLARRTPLLPSAALGRALGREVRLKLETLQDTGAFKIRGAANKLLGLSEAERARGVVAISSGNHGRGVAYAANRLGIRAVVCMGSLVPQNKIEAIRALGAEVRIVGDSQDEAEVEAKRLVEEEGLIEAHPFDDPAIIAGQGTIGLELLKDWPDLDSVVAPLSGGGLIGGIAIAVKAAAPHARVIGVSMERGAAMIESQRAGKPIFVEELSTLADALGGGIGLENRYTFDLVRDLVDETLTVGESEIAGAMRHLFFEEQQVVEGAGAVGVAALLSGRLAALGDKIAVVVSGRGVDMADFLEIIKARSE
jgi:threonine dehydratase